MEESLDSTPVSEEVRDAATQTDEEDEFMVWRTLCTERLTFVEFRKTSLEKSHENRSSCSCSELCFGGNITSLFPWSNRYGCLKRCGGSFCVVLSVVLSALANKLLAKKRWVKCTIVAPHTTTDIWSHTYFSVHHLLGMACGLVGKTRNSLTFVRIWLLYVLPSCRRSFNLTSS